MRRTNGDKVKNVTIEVLDALLGAVENLTKASLDKKEAYKIINGVSNQEWTVSAISKFLNNLKRRGYVEVKQCRGYDSVEFTNKAKLAVIDRVALKVENGTKHCFVSFDIPEIMKSRRNAFRRAIKRIGFRQIQKSLWVCDKSVGDLVELASEEYQVSKFVVYIVSDQTNIENFISSSSVSAND